MNKFYSLENLINKKMELKNGEMALEDRLLLELEVTSIQNQILENQKREVISGYLAPSSIAGCPRAGFLKMNGVKPTASVEADLQLLAFSEQGMDRHYRIQKLISSMNTTFRAVTVAEHITDRCLDLEITKEKQFETMVLDHNLKLKYAVDGILEDKKTGERYILEIKTTGKGSFSGIEIPTTKHKYQVSAYAISLQVNKVIFIYEEREGFGKKVIIFNVDQEWEKKVTSKITTIVDSVAKNNPPKMLDKRYCSGCSYEGICNKKDTGRIKTL